MAKIKNVEPVPGEYFTFSVHSRSRPGQKHRVEVDAYNWNGSCTCEHFGFGMAKDLSRGVKPEEDEYRCYHIMAARSYFMEEVAPKIGAEIYRQRREQLGQKQPEPKKEGRVYYLDQK